MARDREVARAVKLTWHEQNQMCRANYRQYKSFLKINYFRLFFGLVSADGEKLFAVVHLPPKSLGKLVFDGGSDDPLPGRVEAALDSRRPASFNFAPGKRKKSVGVIGLVGDHLDAFHCQRLLHTGVRVDWCIVPE
jgi:hypothetical protein